MLVSRGANIRRGLFYGILRVIYVICLCLLILQRTNPIFVVKNFGGMVDQEANIGDRINIWCMVEVTNTNHSVSWTRQSKASEQGEVIAFWNKTFDANGPPNVDTHLVYPMKHAFGYGRSFGISSVGLEDAGIYTCTLSIKVKNPEGYKEEWFEETRSDSAVLTVLFTGKLS